MFTGVVISGVTLCLVFSTDPYKGSSCQPPQLLRPACWFAEESFSEFIGFVACFILVSLVVFQGNFAKSRDLW